MKRKKQKLMDSGLAMQITMTEGLKVQVNIAQASEIVFHLKRILRGERGPSIYGTGYTQKAILQWLKVKK